MPLNNKLVLANRFALAFSKATQEQVEMTLLIRNRDLYKDCVRHGLLSSDPALAELSARVNEAENFFAYLDRLPVPASDEGTPKVEAKIEVSGPPGDPQPSTSTIPDSDWEKLKTLTIEVSGPIGGILVQRVRNSSPESLAQAVEAIALGLGGQGEKFRALAQKIR